MAQAEQPRKLGFEERTDITWGQIGGLREVKQKVIESIEFPFKYRDLYAKYGKSPLKGVLLYGPPGCGKTLIGKAIATSVARLWGKGTSGSFIYVKAPEILDKFVGNSEASIRELFARAYEFKKENGFPAVIFLDEVDGILSRRGTGGELGGVRDSVVATFLTEMDGMKANGALVIMATNRPNHLDPAIIREGRIDQKIYIPRPNREESESIFGVHLSKRPIARSESRTTFGGRFADMLFSDATALYTVRTKERGVKTFSLGHLASGALIATLVELATTYAIRREIRGKGKAESGLILSDAEKAVKDIHAQNLELEHREELDDFLKGLNDEIVGIEKPFRAAPQMAVA